MPDFNTMTCSQLWDWIEDPARLTDNRWVPAAMARWQEHCAENYPGFEPGSGGGRMGGLPPHG